MLNWLFKRSPQEPATVISAGAIGSIVLSDDETLSESNQTSILDALSLMNDLQSTHGFEIAERMSSHSWPKRIELTLSQDNDLYVSTGLEIDIGGQDHNKVQKPKLWIQVEQGDKIKTRENLTTVAAKKALDQLGFA